MELNAREQLEAAATWLGYQSETMAFGLRSAEDGLNLWKAMCVHDDWPEFADDWTPAQRIEVIGYCPFMTEEEDTALEEACEALDDILRGEY